MNAGARDDAGAGRLRAAARRRRLPLRRSGRARCQDPRRRSSLNTAASYMVRSTINSAAAAATEAALQEGLARYELNTAAATVSRAPRPISRTAIKRSGRTKRPSATRPGAALSRRRACRSTTCIGPPRSCWRTGRERKGGGDTQCRSRRRPDPAAHRLERRRSAAISRSHDVVRVGRRGRRKAARGPSCACRPQVQGAALVLENRTGRILAMAGGFSYPLSQLNRATQAHRQPGSALKPLTYLAALSNGLQPNTLVWDSPMTPAADRQHMRERRRLLAPKNYDGGSSGVGHPAARAGELEEPRHRAASRRRHRGRPGARAFARLRTRARGPTLCRMRAPLSVRARRAAGAAGRSRRVLCGGRERRRAADAACDRDDRGERPHRLRAQGRRPWSGSAPPTAAAFFQLKSILQGVRRARHRASLRGPLRPMSPARPAPPTTRTTPGSSASPTT